jgi:cold shock CspA family protein
MPRKTAACAAAGRAEAAKPRAARGAQIRVVSFETSQGQKGPQADNVQVI